MGDEVVEENVPVTVLGKNVLLVSKPVLVPSVDSGGVMGSLERTDAKRRKGTSVREIQFRLGRA